MMSNANIGLVALVTWAGYGVQILKTEDLPEQCTMWISVPEKSYKMNARNEMMAGKNLAARFKTVFEEMTGKAKKIVIKFKVREGENWTEADAEKAEHETKMNLTNGWAT